MGLDQFLVGQLRFTPDMLVEEELVRDQLSELLVALERREVGDLHLTPGELGLREGDRPVGLRGKVGSPHAVEGLWYDRLFELFDDFFFRLLWCLLLCFFLRFLLLNLLIDLH